MNTSKSQPNNLHKMRWFKTTLAAGKQELMDEREIDCGSVWILLLGIIIDVRTER